MEVNEQNLQALSTYLSSTLHPDPAIRKPAEEFLQRIESNQGYVVLLMTFLQNDTTALDVRTACAIALKNYAKRNWRIVEGESKVADVDRQLVRQTAMELMLRCNNGSIQRQLTETISLIGMEDFPERWPELLPSITTYIQSNDYRTINCVLQLANTLFKRYRSEMKSNQLWMEIKYVLDNFAPAFTELFQKTLVLAKQQSQGAGDTSKESVEMVFNCLALIAKIFHSLNAQDLPEFFEDHMSIWMGGFLDLLTLEAPAVLRGDADASGEAGILEHLYSSICDSIAMYAQKYEEEFAPLLPPFVGVVWRLLLSTGTHTKYDLLAANAIQFLSSICQREQYKNLFESGDILAQICERIIVPNLEFRSSDEEMFEDNPEEFIRKDIEGSDVDTRRRAAADFVKALCVQFEAAVISIFSAYIQQLFAQYSSNPTQYWGRKDAAVFLVVSLASRGQTARLGATKTSELVNLTDFYNSHIKPELFTEDVNYLPVLKAVALKYLVTFRSQLPKDALKSCFPAIVRLLKADSVVVHTYAAHAFERICTLRDAMGTGPMVTKNDVVPLAGELLNNLFDVLQKPGSQENEYAMKCIMRCLVLLDDAVLGSADVVMERLMQKLYLVAKNPSKPHFNHYLFESICVVVKSALKSTSRSEELGTKLESYLFPAFEEILRTDVVEFMPYVFQILSLMLDLRGVSVGVPETYLRLYPCLLTPALWERNGNVPALVKLLQAYLRVGAAQVTDNDGLSPLLGISKRLIDSRANDHEGFYLLNSIVEFCPWSTVQQYAKAILEVLFGRLSRFKTVKYVKGLLVFFALFIIKYEAVTLITLADDIQAGIFGMLLERVILPDLQKVTGSVEKKICCVGYAKLLVSCPEIMVSGKYGQYWSRLLQSIVAVFELPEADVTEDEYFVNVEDTPGYTAAYSQLVFAMRPDSDPTNVKDAKSYLANSIQTLNVSRPGCLETLFRDVDEHVKAFTLQYMNAAGVVI